MIATDGPAERDAQRGAERPDVDTGRGKGRSGRGDG